MLAKHTFMLLLLLLFTASSLFAQEPPINNTQQSLSKLTFIRPGGPGLSDLANYGKLNRTEGTPFLYDDWAPGRVRYEGQPNNSEILDILPDLENNQLNIRLSSGYIGEFPMDRLDAVIVYGPDQDTVAYEIQDLHELFGIGDHGRRFYQVLHRGSRYLVLHQPIKYLRREEYVENLGMVRRPDKYMERNRYFIFDGTQLLEVKNNLRNISKAFPRKASTIKRLVRTNDLDLGNNEDLGRLFALLEES